MQAPLDIRYAGVSISRAQEARTAEGEATFFLPGKEPMPVGTVLRLRSNTGETPARVVRAIESPDPAVCGMQVRLIGEEEAVAADVIPPPAPAKPKPSPAPPAAVPPATPTPTDPIDVAPMEAEAERLPPAPAPEGSAVPEAVPTAVGSSLTGALAKATAATAPAEPPPAPPAPVPAAPTKAHDTSEDLDIVITNTPPPISPASVVPVVAPFDTDPGPTPPPPAAEAGATAREAAGVDGQAVPAEHGERNREAVLSDSGERNGEAAPAGDTPPTSDQMPTARAIAGPSSRRKTKRRRSS